MPSIASIKQVASSFKGKYGFKCNVQGLAPVYMHHAMPDSQDKDEFTGTIIDMAFWPIQMCVVTVILR